MITAWQSAKHLWGHLYAWICITILAFVWVFFFQYLPLWIDWTVCLCLSLDLCTQSSVCLCINVCLCVSVKACVSVTQDLDETVAYRTSWHFSSAVTHKDITLYQSYCPLFLSFFLSFVYSVFFPSPSSHSVCVWMCVCVCPLSQAGSSLGHAGTQGHSSSSAAERNSPSKNRPVGLTNRLPLSFRLLSQREAEGYRVKEKSQPCLRFSIS